MSVVLACAWQPRGEMQRFERYFSRLQTIYDNIVVAVQAGEPGTPETVALLDKFGVPHRPYANWSGRHTTVKLALETGADYIHYVDMDRLVRWIELRPDELAQIVERLQTVDSLIIGRTPAAYATHSRTLVETEALPNAFFSHYLGRKMDFSAGSRSLSRQAAELVLRCSPGENALVMDAGWAVLVHRAGLAWDYVEVEGLDWETADRYRDAAADSVIQRALAVQHDADPKQWDWRVRVVAQGITMLGLAAIQEDLDGFK
ncbi:MAG: hypothetical protein H7X77_02930 [Anaerolineae bacterium]|nr:hypothetical protein [Anaerolineae bacterium]